MAPFRNLQYVDTRVFDECKWATSAWHQLYSGSLINADVSPLTALIRANWQTRLASAFPRLFLESTATGAHPRDRQSSLLLGSVAEFTSPLILLINKDAILDACRISQWPNSALGQTIVPIMTQIIGYDQLGVCGVCRHINHIFK